MIEINKAYCIDAIEGMKQMIEQNMKVDMILCDLPYGTTACNWDVIIPFEPLWDCYKKLIKDNGAIVLTASQPFTSMLVMSNLKMFKYEWIWEKSRGTNFLDANRKPMKYHENILVFYKKLPTYNPQGVIKGNFDNRRPCLENKNYNEGRVYGLVNQKPTISKFANYPKSIQKFHNPNNKTIHPTQKPVPLFEYLTKTYTNEGDLVLDNACGSGTTAVACRKTNRNWICFDNRQECIDTTNKRLKEML